MDMSQIGPVLAAQGVSVCGGFLPFDCDSERESDRKWTSSSPRRYPINSRCSPLGSDQLAAGKRNSTVSTRSRSTRRQPSKTHGSAESAASSEAENLFETCARSPETVGGVAHVRAAERDAADEDAVFRNVEHLPDRSAMLGKRRLSQCRHSLGLRGEQERSHEAAKIERAISPHVGGHCQQCDMRGAEEAEVLDEMRLARRAVLAPDRKRLVEREADLAAALQIDALKARG